MTIPVVDGEEGCLLDSTPERTWKVEQGTVPRGPDRTYVLRIIFDNYIYSPNSMFILDPKLPVIKYAFSQ